MYFALYFETDANCSAMSMWSEEAWLIVNSSFSFCNFAVILIGFDPDAYEVDEEEGIVFVTVAVLDGSLNTDVVIRLNTSDGTAVCKF